MKEKAKRTVTIEPNEKAESRRILRLIIGFVVVVFILPVCACIACVGTIFVLTQPVVDASSAFLTDLQNDDYDAAYEQLTYRLQESVGSPERLGAYVRDFDGRPDRWRFVNRQIDGETGSLKGSITTASGSQHTIMVNLEVWDGEWLISRVQYGNFLLEQ